MNAIHTESLTKKFSNMTAINDMSFSVDENEIFGFLGPNGAGKSTTMMILTTLLKATSGSAKVCGYDVSHDAKQVRKKIGFVQQDILVDEYLTGRENLLLQAKLNHLPRSIIDQRIDDTLNLIDMTDRQHESVVTYSGGMRKRLDIAGGLLHRPQVLFLDEPTVGLDIQTRKKIWDHIRHIHQEFKISILVSTHYMQEADDLCSRIAIIDHGTIQLIDTPKNIKSSVGNDIISFDIAGNSVDINTFVEHLQSLDSIKEINFDSETRNIRIFSSNNTFSIPDLFQISTKLSIKITSFSLKQPSLDDAFIAYTGHELKNDAKFDRRKEYRRRHQ